MRGRYARFLPLLVVTFLGLSPTSLDRGLANQGQAPQGVAQAGPLRLEDGTPVKLRLSHTISSATAQLDDRVDFEVLEEVKVGDLLAVPKGSIAWGTVTQAQAKRRMGKAGKLDINIDSVRLADGEKAALRGVKAVQGGGHTGAMTGAIVATSLVAWPAAPFFLFMHGKDITIPQGTELTVYINGDFPFDAAKFGKPNVANPPLSTPTAQSPGAQPATPGQPAGGTNPRALGKADIVDLLKGQVPSPRVIELVKERSIKFTPSEDDYKEIRAAGGSDDLINVLKAEALLKQ